MHPYIVSVKLSWPHFYKPLLYITAACTRLSTHNTFTIKDRRQKIIMAQTVVVALCIAAAVAAAASVPSASASDQTTAMHLLPVEAAEVLTKGRAGGVAIQKELTGGIQRELLDESWIRDAEEARSGVAGIQSQRELLGESWVGGADEQGRIYRWLEGLQPPLQLVLQWRYGEDEGEEEVEERRRMERKEEEEEISPPRLCSASATDEARSGVAGIQTERQLTATDAIPATTEKLLPVGAAEILTKGRAGGVAIQKELTGVNVPAA
jgi:hypothetical protein